MAWRGCHLRNDPAVSHMDGALPNFGQRHTWIGFWFAGGPTHHLREVTLWSPRQLPIYTRLVNPGFLGEPVVIGLADRAEGAREEYRTASKAFAIRFDAGRDRASRLRAFDHEYTHLQPPFFYFAFSFAAGRSVADRLDCTSPRVGSSLQPIRPPLFYI